MSKDLVLALDIGTTSAKAVLFELNGKLVAEAERMVTSYYPHTEWVEQDPIEIERASVGAINDVMKKSNWKQDDVLTLGISCAMHSLICVDANYNPLSQALIWADGRSNEQAKKLKETVGDSIYANTGTSQSSNVTAK